MGESERKPEQPQSKAPLKVGYVKKQGWVVEDPGERSNRELQDLFHNQPTTSEFVKQKIKALRNAGKKIPRTLSDME